MIVDSHQHYWKISRTDYGWLKPSVGKIYADYMPEQLKPLLAQFQIDKTVIVQAAPSADETEFMLQIAAEEETVAGVVGWLDLAAAEFEQQWNRFRADPKFVGLRPMIQDLASDWLLNERVMHHLNMLAEAEFPLDLQANVRHLPHIVKLLEQVPKLRAVIDHLAKPNMAEGQLEPWSTYMTEIASYPNTMCKLSGMVYGDEDAPWTREKIKPFAEHAIEAFGKQRVMFGTDWPVCLLSATYEEVLELFSYCLGENWSEEERDDVYGHNAIRFYHLNVT